VSEEVSAILDAETRSTATTPSRSPPPGSTAPSTAKPTTAASSAGSRSSSSYEPVEGRRHWTGRIVACDDGIVTLELVGEKASARVPLAKVSHGRLEVEFPKNG
jgi:hypothetical protein